MRDEIVPVRENLPLTGSHFLLTVESPAQAQAARPGQFVMLRLLGRDARSVAEKSEKVKRQFQV